MVCICFDGQKSVTNQFLPSEWGTILGEERKYITNKEIRIMTSNILEKKSVVNNKENQITSKVAPWLSKVAYAVGAKIVLPFFFNKFTVSGTENIPQKGAVIVAPNHRSRWDAIVVPYAVGRLSSGRDPHFMVSANEMKGIQGWFVSRLGGFPVNVERPGTDSLIYSFDLLSQGEMVVIFPEGGIFRTDEVQPLKRGVAKIALDVEEVKPEVEIKILPVRIRYDQLFPKRGCSVEIIIGESLNIRDYAFKANKENSIKVTQDLESSLKNL